MHVKMQLGLVLGLMLAVILGVGLQYGAKLFSKDANVLHLMSIGIPVPPLNRQQTRGQVFNSIFSIQMLLELTCLLFQISLLWLLNRSILWHLSLMVSTLEPLISHIQHTPWQVYDPIFQ